MSEIAVRARSLTKRYTLYSTPWDRVREILGFRRKAGAYPEHVAVDGIDLDIRFGEKVAFIGRNGAGKSTLLKLITGVIEPTDGKLEINGHTHALLQMGAGFHQDFTGRENTRGYLANLGVSGAEADRLIDGIIEFSELEEYIDQPLKTYSTGMQMRLIFAASTTIAPKLFVVDEVLGVGDAYFQQKSLSRIEEMCERNQTTLLLVSHDIYTAAKICARMVWIDRGRIKFDGDPKTALNLYESSIKEQEEQRLRRKATMVSDGSSAGQGLVVEIFTPNREPIRGELHVSSLKLGYDGKVVAEVPILDEANSGRGVLHESYSWGGISTTEGRRCREALAISNPFQKIGCLIDRAAFPSSEDFDPTRVSVDLEVHATDEELLQLQLLADQHIVAKGSVSLTGTGWQEICCQLNGEAIAAERRLELTGSGRVWIEHVALKNTKEEETHFFKSGDLINVDVEVRTARSQIEDKLDFQVLMAFTRDGTDEVCRLLSSSLSGDPGARLLLRFPNDGVRLGSGEYTLTLMIVEPGYFDAQGEKFYSYNEKVYCTANRIKPFLVASTTILDKGAKTIIPGKVAVTKIEPIMFGKEEKTDE